MLVKSGGKIYYCLKGANGEKVDALEHSPLCAEHRKMKAGYKQTHRAKVKANVRKNVTAITATHCHGSQALRQHQPRAQRHV
jgi:hypothetical protein